MSNNNSALYSGIGFLEILSLIFITLKLLKKIDWSWWAVLSPLWVPVAVFVGFLVILFLVYVVIELGSIVQYKIWKK
jgi:hypothetical protein